MVAETTSGYTDSPGYSAEDSTSTVNSYVWFTGAEQSQINYEPNTAVYATAYTTALVYDAGGDLTEAWIDTASRAPSPTSTTPTVR